MKKYKGRNAIALYLNCDINDVTEYQPGRYAPRIFEDGQNTYCCTSRTPPEGFNWKRVDCDSQSITGKLYVAKMSSAEDRIKEEAQAAKEMVLKVFPKAAPIKIQEGIVVFDHESKRPLYNRYWGVPKSEARAWISADAEIAHMPEFEVYIQKRNEELA